MRRWTLAVRFTTPTRTPLADALRTVRVIEVDAPTAEAAEHYVSLVVRALERAAG